METASESSIIRASYVGASFTVFICAAFSYVWLRYLKQRQEKKQLAALRKDARSRYTTAKRKLFTRLQEIRQNDAQCDTLWANITDLAFEELCNGLRAGKLRCVDVLRAFQHRALSIDKRTNCIVQPIMEAETWATELDKIPVKERSRLPLFGIPVSFKECFQVQHYESAIGLARFLGNFHDRDSAMVKAFRQVGAIPFLLSNVPQTMLSYSSMNPINGITSHFLKGVVSTNDGAKGKDERDSISPGGSSSGEGVLCGSRGSPLGVASDAGGSIRVPASLCGAAALMSTASRTWRRGRTTYFEGPSLVWTANGPVSTHVDALVRVARALWPNVSSSHGIPETYPQKESPIRVNSDELDAHCCPLPFDETLFGSRKPLRIGFFLTNGLANPLPAVQRAVKTAASWLAANGHELVEWTPPEPEKAWLIYQSAVLTNMRRLKQVLQNDEIAASTRMIYRLIHLPNFVRRFIQFILRAIGKRILADHLGLCRDLQPVPTRKFFELHRHVEEYRQQFADSWRSAQLDAVLCPTFASVALPHSLQLRARSFGTYAMLFNLVEFCAGTVPVARVTEEDIRDAAAWCGGTGEERFERDVRVAVQRTLGFPVGVQLAVAPFRDEVVLRLLAELEIAAKTTRSYVFEKSDEFCQEFDF